MAAVIAGMIALFAPCCISVMLPAYFAGSFQNRRLLVAMTFLFAAGVATVILPIALGASIVRELLTAQHSLLYIAGGALMLGLAIYVLCGGQLHLPMPGRRTSGHAGPLSVYTLGIFSGMASSCCAPVLAGVIALSSVASSFALSMGLGVAYVFGMVAPLFVISLLWERADWRTSRLFRPRAVTWHLGALRRTVSMTDLASGILLVIIGGSMLWIGLVYRSMPPLAGWQIEAAVQLQHVGLAITQSLAWIPGWLAVVVLLGVLALLARRALRETDTTRADSNHADAGRASAHRQPSVSGRERPRATQDAMTTAAAAAQDPAASAGDYHEGNTR